MSSLAEIKHRIASVRDTKKITNAMYLIASTKVRKAKSDLDKTRPYFSAMQKEISRVSARAAKRAATGFIPTRTSISRAERAAYSSSPRTKGSPARITRTC